MLRCYLSSPQNETDSRGVILEEIPGEGGAVCTYFIFSIFN
jgi:hypothetical protein